MLELTRIYNDFKDFVGDSSLSLLKFIRLLNLVLLDLELTKPAEQISKIYYCRGFNKYPLPTEGFRDIISLRDDNYNFFRYVSPYIFQLYKYSQCFSDQSDAGIRYLLINNNATSSLTSLITECDSLTDDGVWTISGGSNLAINSTEKKSGGGSLQFDVSGITTTLTFTRTNVIDASSYTEHMRLRMFMKLPTLPSRIVIRVGNDSSNYFEHTISAQVSGEPFTTDDWNELEFSRQSATETGTVDLENIDWFQVELNFGSSTTDTNFLLDKPTLIKPEPLDLEWYTSYVALDNSNSLKERIDEDENTTDKPLIYKYPDYLKTLLNGLAWLYLKNKAPKMALEYKQNYFAEYDRRGKLVGGKMFLARRYPNRAASYRRRKRLPSLYTGNINDIYV